MPQLSQLDQLRELTTVVADTGDIEAIKRYQPVDATTNPSLLLKAAQMEQYGPLLRSAKQWAASQEGSDAEILGYCVDKFAVEIGREILQVIPGRISTEVDARLSFNTRATVERAQRLIDLYQQADIPAERVLIKIASTWEGVRAAEQLERSGINCNLTLLFGFGQAQACADAGVHLISPFVGRILDWHKANSGRDSYPAHEDPGVLSVARIFNYYKAQGYKTVVMGASFRNIDEIRHLAGCDRLTISPALLDELGASSDPLPRKLFADNPVNDDPRQSPTEQDFRWTLNEDAMATEKLAEGIRNFAADQNKLEAMLKAMG
ncbi:transaldolase [Aestuariirhabdus litorea]|uniref:Transaldolase n=1 Tax=Aestuariirhabdus litorea TaxID=2528527 RepID=A0A3P3VQV1_9GAMM|nr:transaldolase [Aestuariirhabdus litorea]RRJ84834.1 transaldolase [Aestuariirhabdus litorea]RWW98059.1 transaldolase [Endozoicomonadaceae bacterium GTF-13]